WSSICLILHELDQLQHNKSISPIQTRLTPTIFVSRFLLTTHMIFALLRPYPSSPLLSFFFILNPFNKFDVFNIISCSTGSHIQNKIVI
ncbi:MAG: hypothetical protein EXX96DRAFT_491171, partial [Benjaminiella poitrasii]